MVATNTGVLRARGRTCACAALLACLACALTALAVLVPAAASAASTTTRTDPALGIPIPASARVKGAIPTSTTTTTTTPATSTPASSTPASSTPAASTPASTTPGSAQPGTVAPATTTPATTTVPATTTSAPTNTTPTTTTRSGTVVVVTHKSTSKGTHLSTAALVLAVLGALLALGAIVWALARWLALEPRWTVSLVYSLREASSRASATWAEFSDWVRLGH